MATVKVHDYRSGHDGAGNGGMFGGYSYLIVSDPTIVTQVTTVNKSRRRIGKVNTYSNEEESTYEYDENLGDGYIYLVERYDGQAALGRESKCTVTLIAGMAPEEYPPAKYERAYREYQDSLWPAYEAERDRLAMEFVKSNYPGEFEEYVAHDTWYPEGTPHEKWIWRFFTNGWNSLSIVSIVKREIQRRFQALPFEEEKMVIQNGYVSLNEYMWEKIGWRPPTPPKYPQRDYFVANALGQVKVPG